MVFFEKLHGRLRSKNTNPCPKIWFIFSLVWTWMILLPACYAMRDYYHSESSFYVPSWNHKLMPPQSGDGHEEPKTCAVKIDDDAHGYHAAKYDTFKDHPCRRECIKGLSMVCHYKMVAHHYHSMGPECRNCWNNNKVCAQEHCIPFDGTATSLKVINHQYPGPSIEVCQHDTIIVDLLNNMTEPTVMHWHGIHMSATPESDGAPMITQNLLQPGDTHRVCFEADRRGTIWYHSHVGWQRAEGMAGRFVVHIPWEVNPHLQLYDCDDSDHVVLIQDVVYNGEFNRPRNLLINGKGRKPDATKPDDDPGHRYERLHVDKGSCYRMRFISNGIFNCPVEVSMEKHVMTVIAVDGNDIEPIKANKFHVASGERIDVVVCAKEKVNTYWISFKGMFDCGSFQQYGILHYNGAPAKQIPKPITPTAIATRSGISTKKNADVVVNAIAEYGDPNIMRKSIIMEDMEEHSNDMFNQEVSNTVEPNTVPGLARTFIKDNNKLHEKDMMGVKNIHRLALPNDVAEFTGRNLRNLARSIVLNLTSTTIATVGLRSVRPVELYDPSMCKKFYISLGILVSQGEVSFQMDDITFALPSMSLLQNNGLFRDDDYFCNRTSLQNANLTCTTGNCKGTNVVRIPACECIEFVVVNYMSSTHPFHLHGYTFRVLTQQTVGNLTALKNIEDYDRRGLIQRLPTDYPAVEKDVIQVPGLGVAVVQFKSNNPGYWLAHCHIERHTLLGMKIVIKVGENNQIKKPLTKSKCSDYACYR